MSTQAVNTAEITAAELKNLLDRSDELVIIDVRDRDEFERWPLEGRAKITAYNIPYFELLEHGEGHDDVTQGALAYAQAHWVDVIPKDRKVVTVCAHGGGSAGVGEALRQLGYDAVNLKGGMQAWGNYYEAKIVAQEPELTIYQVNRPARGCLSYIVASQGEAVIIDPLRHEEEYVRIIDEKGWKPVAVFDTHGHADHISSGPALAKHYGVPYYLHPYDAIHPLDVMPATIAYESVRDGQTWQVGSVTLRAMHVPGHTLGNLVFVLDDRFVFTGDSIFVDSVARPDLGGRGETWAPLHYRSLRRILELPDDTLVLPGHFSHPREADENGVYARTLRWLKENNEGVKALMGDEASFVKYLLDSLPFFPEQYVDIKRVNAGLLVPDEEKASELELGRNICALAQAYAAS